MRAALLAFACAASAPFAHVTLKGDPQTELFVDGAPAGTLASYARGLSLPAGHHRFELRHGGEVQVREATLGPGDVLSLDVGE